MDQDNKDFVKGAAIAGAVGLVAGAIAGIMFAPKSGKETREDIKNYLHEMKDKIAEQLAEVKDLTKEKYEEVIENVVGKYKETKKISEEQAVEVKKDLAEGYDKIREALNK